MKKNYHKGDFLCQESIDTYNSMKKKFLSLKQKDIQIER